MEIYMFRARMYMLRVSFGVDYPLDTYAYAMNRLLSTAIETMVYEEVYA